MRNTFDAELQELNRELVQMSAAAEDAIDVVTASLSAQDRQEALSAMEAARSMDRMERDIEDRCIRLLLRQQPVAGDLRTISAALKMVTDLRRIGDQCANIAEISLLLQQQNQAEALTDIRTMSRKAAVMVKGAIAAYVARDAGAAWMVIAQDDEVDGLYVQVKNTLAARIAAEGGNGNQAIDLAIIAKYLERIADHGVNIARWAIFCVTGELVPEDPAE